MTQQIDQPQRPDPEIGSRQRSLIDAIKAWVAPPVFPKDDEKTRRAAILNTVMIGVLVFGTLYGLTLPWTASNDLPVVILTLTLIASSAFGLFNIRQGRVVQTIYIVTILVWMLAAGGSALFGGVSSPMYASFVVLILAVGLLMGYRWSILFSGATILYGLILMFLENSGALPGSQVVSTNYFIRFSLIFIIATFLIYLTNRNILNTLNQAQETQRHLKKTNQELLEIKQRLEGTVGENARQIERRNTYLETAAKIAQNTIAVKDLQDMLNLAVDQIADRFGYYHVGIFLTDENNFWANLQAASSEGGRQMIARGHRLGVGKQGIVGYVTGIGKPRITQDIGLDRIHSVTQELPETRAEMALPLKVRNQIIGALDIQERVPDAFSEEDISALQIIANQISLAIGNIRLSQEAEQRLQEVQRVYGEVSQKAWVDTHRQKALSGYRLSSGDLIPVTDPQASLESDNKMEVPIIVRGRKIGAIEIAKADPLSEWTKDEEELLSTLSVQLGIALDSARLFNESQLRASTEKIIGDINAEIWESLELKSILRTTVEKLQKTLELPEVSIKMTPPPSRPQQSSNGNPLDVDESN
jgi:GAF domain-containing protein